MTLIHQPVETERRPLLGAERQRGFASGCLIAAALVITVLIGAGIYVANNYRAWTAKAVCLAMTAVITESDLPNKEKKETIEILNRLKNNYIAGDIHLAELGRILEAMAECPALPVGIVMQFEASYVSPSGLSDAEKEHAHLNLNRFAQGLTQGVIGWDQLDEVTAPILAFNSEGKRELKPPHRCTDYEIRQVMVSVQSAADQQNIPAQIVDIDISDAFLTTIERALGREQNSPANDL